MKKIIFVVTCFFAIHSTNIFAQGGIPDSSFGINGKTSANPGSIYDFGYSVALQTDGKILVAGSSATGLGPVRDENRGGVSLELTNSGFDIVRFKYNGVPDHSFGQAGIVSVNMGTVNGASAAHAVAVQSDGKILITGYAWNGSNDDVAIVRLNLNGTPDSSFAGTGIVATAFGPGNDIANAVFIQSDNKIVIAGYADDGLKYDFASLRLNSDGSFDRSFGTNGMVLTDLGGVSNFANSVVVQPNGKIIIAGIIAYNSNANDFAVVRYNADGTIDNSFGIGGLVKTTFGKINVDAAESVVLQTDGKIVVAGYANFKFAVARYKSSGMLDKSFGNKGKIQTAIGIAGDYGYGAIIQPDGKIVVAGSTQQGSYNYFALVRYQSNGRPDSSFGSNGIVTTSFFGYADYARAIALEADGKIIAVGYASKGNQFGLLYYDYAVARYLPDLNLQKIDFTKENNSLFIYPNPLHQSASLRYTLDKDETISIDLYDLNGRIVRSFISNEQRIKGEHLEQLYMDASLPNGNYVLQLSNGNQCVALKIIKQ